MNNKCTMNIVFFNTFLTQGFTGLQTDEISISSYCSFNHQMALLSDLQAHRGQGYTQGRI